MPNHPITRRKLLQAGAAAVTGAALSTLTRPLPAAPAALAPSKPPNILLIMTDEHDPGVTGCYGNKLVRTPNIDALAQRSIVLENAYCNSPLCVPSRSAFTSCKYISRTSVWNNNCWLPSDDMPSIARVMNAAGYESILCGKMHYDKTRSHGFTEIGQFNNNFMSGFGHRRAANDTSINLHARDSRFAEFVVADHSATLNHDRRVLAAAVDFLSKRNPSDKPLFMVIGFLAPHFPITVAKSYYDPYAGKVPMPNIPPGHLDTLPLNYQHLRRGFGVVQTDPAKVQKGRDLYYGLTQWIDEQIGTIIKTAKSRGLDDNTVTIYCADHGEQAGEHGMWWKNSMYQRSAGIPMMVSYPQRWQGGQRRAGACSIVDMVQTVAELGGANVPQDWNGTSMCGWFDDPSTKWKDFALSEYYAHNIASGFVMVRSGQFKYVFHNAPDKNHPEQRELYDLTADPGEFKNLAALPDHADRVQAMHALLLKELPEHPADTEQRCRAEIAKGYGRKGGRNGGGGGDS